MWLEISTIIQCGPYSIYLSIYDVGECGTITVYLVVLRSSLKLPVVVVYHVTIVAIGNGLLKKFWSMMIGCVLRTAGSSIIWNYADPLTSIEQLICYLTLAMSSTWTSTVSSLEATATTMPTAACRIQMLGCTRYGRISRSISNSDTFTWRY